MSERNLPIQVRGYPVIEKRPRVPHLKRPIQLILTFDTETSTDHAQRLHFGCFRLSTVRENDDGTLDLFCIREGIFYADDLEEFFQGGHETIKDYCFNDKYRHARIDNVLPSYDDYRHGQIDIHPEPAFQLMTASEFVKNYIVGLCYTSDIRGTYREFEPATIVGFNLPFDMTRLGKSWAEGRKQFYRAFSVDLTGWLQFRYKRSGAHGWYMELSGKTGASDPGEPRLEAYNMVDVATMAFAIGGKVLGLRAAGEAFGCRWLKSSAEDGHGKITPEYIDYCRQDVRATEDLYRKVMNEWNRHPVSRTSKPDSAYSPASVSKQYMRDMGIVSRLVGQNYVAIEALPAGIRKAARKEAQALGGRYAHKSAIRRLAEDHGFTIPEKNLGQRELPPEIVGRFMAAFFGGRAECRIRMTKVPAVLVDFTSMYPTVMILLKIWEMLTCNDLEIVEVDFREVQRFLESLNLVSDPDDPGWETSLFNPDVWPRLAGIGETDEGYLPIRSEYNGMSGSSPGIGINNLRSLAGDFPYTLLDLAASRIATGVTPPIKRVWMLRASDAKQPTLRPVSLYGDEKLRLDPRTDNLLEMAVEQRHAAIGRHLENAALSDLRELSPIDPRVPCRHLYSPDITVDGHKRREDRPCFDCRRYLREEEVRLNPAIPFYGSSPDVGWETLLWRIQNAHKDENRRSVWNEDRDKCLCPECVAQRFLKVFANAIYGVFAEMNTPKRAKPKIGDIYGLDGEHWEVRNPEEPGEFCFPPFAALITGGARLMLAMLERCVEDAGGCHVFCDTDSLCIVASDQAGTVEGIPVISYDAVNEIRRRFNMLNPYNRELAPELLKWESPKLKPGQTYPERQLYCVAISAKRYCLFYMNGDRPEIVAMVDDQDPSADNVEIEKRSKHGLGLYINPIPDAPKDWWYSEVWLYIINKWILRRDVEEPEWFRVPAAMRLTATTPDMLRAFRDFNDGWPYGDQVKPQNFVLSFTPSKVTRMLYPHMRLITPYASPEELADWENLGDVYDIHGDGTPFRIKPSSELTDEEMEAFLQGDSYPDKKYYRDWIARHPEYVQQLKEGQPVPVSTYRDIVYDYVRHPEVKYDDADGKPCTSRTRGRLYPTTIMAEYAYHIGKTGNPFFNAEKTIDEVHYRDYDTERREHLEWQLALEALPKNASEIALRLEAMGVKVTPQAIRNLITGRTVKARRELRSALIGLARDYAQKKLEGEGFSHSAFAFKSDFLVLVMWHNREMSKDEPS